MATVPQGVQIRKAGLPSTPISPSCRRVHAQPHWCQSSRRQAPSSSHAESPCRLMQPLLLHMPPLKAIAPTPRASQTSGQRHTQTQACSYTH
eukprot:4157325-Prorocentrum_lima.AAC.1